MPATKLTAHSVEKPWGRRKLPGCFATFETGNSIGEVWFTGGEDADPPLLVKYLFTSEKLSVQVHPDDAAARARGLPRGKDEAWLILDAAAESTIALGPVQPLDEPAFRAAAQDGSIVDLLHWQPVKAGDFIYSPAGTVHAIGSGLALIEIQQNLDLTYRLYDYGRPRELHLDDGVTVSKLMRFEPLPASSDDRVLAEGAKFVVERRKAGQHKLELGGVGALLIPVAGQGHVDDRPIAAGECWTVNGTIALHLEPGAEALIAYPGAQRL